MPKTVTATAITAAPTGPEPGQKWTRTGPQVGQNRVRSVPEPGQKWTRAGPEVGQAGARVRKFSRKFSNADLELAF